MLSGKKSGFVGVRGLVHAGVSLWPLMCLAAPAYAQAAEAELNSQEIIVTAQRREQSLIDVPAAITAIGGEAVKTLNVTSMPSIAQQVPSFTISYERGKNTTPTFNLRGIESDGLASRLNESSVAIYTDDVFLGDEAMLNGSLFDLKRVEILRGPQGTVFGRNTTGGLVHFVSEAPTDRFSGYASALYGADNATTLEAAASGPVSDTIRVRVAGAWDRNDGHYNNIYRGAGANGIHRKLGARNVWGIRGTVDIDLSEKTLLRVIASHNENHSETTPIFILGILKPGTTVRGPYNRTQVCSMGQILDAACISDVQVQGGLPNSPRNAGNANSSFTPSRLKAEGKGTSITAKLVHTMDWAELTSITNYSRNRFFQGLDAGRSSPTINGPESPFYAPRFNKAHQLSQELRLNGSVEAFDWVFGAFYYEDDKHNDSLIDATVFGAQNFAAADVSSRSYASFGQLDAHLNDEVTVTVGGRYTIDMRDLDSATTYNGLNRAGTFQDVRAYMISRKLATKTNTKDFTGKLGVTWKPSSDDSYYFSFSRGIKGAGFNGGFSPSSTIAANAILAGPVGQEVLDSIELGAKNRFFDRKLSINSAVFLYNYQGKQVSIPVVDNATGAAQFNYINVGTARIWGAETEIAFRPNRRWNFSASGSWLGNKITKSNVVTTDSFGAAVSLDGKKLPRLPRWTFNAIAAYHLPVQNLGEFTLQVESNGLAKRNFSVVNDPIPTDEAHVFANVRVMWQSTDGRYKAQLFVTNVFDERQALNMVDTVTGRNGKLIVAEGEGRLWGVKAGVNF